MIAIPTLTKGVPFVMRRTIFGSCCSAENTLHQVDQFVGIYRFTEASVNVSWQEPPSVQDETSRPETARMYKSGHFLLRSRNCRLSTGTVSRSRITARQEFFSMRSAMFANEWDGMPRYCCASSRLHSRATGFFVGIDHDDRAFHWRALQSGSFR